MLTDRNGLEVLTRAEALRLLATQSVGRIGVTSNALPVILPVNFAVVDGEILIKTGRGTKLDAATRNTVVAFEVDHADPFSHTGWSVLVTGVARVVDEDLDHERASARIARWAPQPGDRVIAVSMELVSGRRISAGSFASDGVPEWGRGLLGE